jgi:hypothetical protein
MMRCRIQLAALLMLAFTTGACKKQIENEREVLKFKEVYTKELLSLRGKAPDVKLNVELRLQYPIAYSENRILQKIQKSILQDFLPGISDTTSNPEGAMKASIQNRIKLYKSSENPHVNNGELAKAKSTGEYDRESDWWDKSSMKIQYNQNGLLSYTITTDQFVGGDRVNVNLQSSIIDLKTGEKIYEDDLFSEDAIPLIHQMILKKLEVRNQVETPEELEQIGYCDISEIGLYKNLYLTPKGVTYTYNAYEIGSYDLGTIEVCLSFEDLKDLIAPSSPLYRIYQ